MKNRDIVLINETLKIIDEMFYNGEKVNFYTVKDKAQVSRKFLYDNIELYEKIDFYRKLNPMSDKQRIEFLKEENNSLLERIELYNNQIIDKLYKSQDGTEPSCDIIN